MPPPEADHPSFFLRLAMAFVLFWRILLRPEVARALLPVYRGAAALPSAPPGGPAAREAEALPRVAPAPEREVPPHTRHASGLLVLSMFQREGRFIDFLMEEVAPFSDQEVGAAARIVHDGCRKVLRELVALQPIQQQPEGARVTVSLGFDANRIRLIGNVAGLPPFQGTLKHPGWEATEVHFPTISEAVDPRVLAPAEVEL